MKKTLLWGTVLVILDLTIGAIAIEYFDLIAVAQKYNREIVHTVFVAIPVWLLYALYKKNRFVEKNSGQIKIQLLD